MFESLDRLRTKLMVFPIATCNLLDLDAGDLPEEGETGIRIKRALTGHYRGIDLGNNLDRPARH